MCIRDSVQTATHVRLAGGKGVGRSDSARCAAPPRSNRNLCGGCRVARVLEARTRLGAQLLHVQAATHEVAGGEARVLGALTRLGAQPLHFQTATHVGLEGGMGVGGSDSARCAAAPRSNRNPCGPGGRQVCWRLGLGSVRSRSAFEPQPMRALEGSCLLYTSPSPRDLSTSRMPSSA